MLKMRDLDLRGKRVLIREDLNVPIDNGQIQSEQRLKAAVPTIRAALERAASVLLMSHLGRPVEGVATPQFSLAPVASYLQKALRRKVFLIDNYLDREIALAKNAIGLLENVRFNIGEKSDDETLSRKYASLCDVFVMDAFGAAHRAQASTHGVARFAAVACAGPLLVAELEALCRALQNPKPPVVAIVGGAKVSTKLAMLDRLSSKVDCLIPGGGIANTFIAAMGHAVGKSLYQPDWIEQSRRLIETARQRGPAIPLPSDVVVGKAFDIATSAQVKAVAEVAADDMIFDVGPQTAASYAEILESAGTIVWNGPLGVFEFEQFSGGTRALAAAIAGAQAFSIVGGGDTLAAIKRYDIASNISYISTGGGAFLAFLQGKTLPAVAILEHRARL